MAKFLTTYFNVSSTKYHQAVLEGRHVCRSDRSIEIFSKYLKDKVSMSEECDVELSQKVCVVQMFREM